MNKADGFGAQQITCKQFLPPYLHSVVISMLHAWDRSDEPIIQASIISNAGTMTYIRKSEAEKKESPRRVTRAGIEPETSIPNIIPNRVSEYLHSSRRPLAPIFTHPKHPLPVHIKNKKQRQKKKKNPVSKRSHLQLISPIRRKVLTITVGATRVNRVVLGTQSQRSSVSSVSSVSGF